MGNTITESSFNRTITWLRQQTSSKKADDKNTNSVVRWVAGRTNATNLSIGSGVLWLVSLAINHFTKDHDNKFLNYLVKGIKWISGIATLLFPFANIGTSKVTRFDIKEKVTSTIANDLGIPKFNIGELHVPNNYTKYEEYNHDNACDLIANLLEDCIEGTFKLDDVSKESLRRILVLNWKVPITASGIGIQGTKIPQTSRSKAYRLGMYRTILKTLKNSDDPLFLKTLMEKVPEDLKTKVKDFRTALQNAYVSEVELEKTNTGQYEKDVVPTIEEILNIAGDSIPDEMPKWKWNKEAQRQKEITEQNQLKLSQFKKWANIEVGSGKTGVYSDTKLEEIFNKFSQPQKENISLVHDLYTNDCYSSINDLKEGFQSLIGLLELDSASWHTHEDSDRNLFLLKYLDAILEKEIRIENQDGNRKGKLRYILESDYLEKIIDHCRLIIHDDCHLYEPKREPDFFMNPKPDTLPGQALIIHHRLSPHCFSDEGYLDVYNLKDTVLRTCAKVINTQRDGNHILNGFVLSGPHETGKRAFVHALANQLAIPIFKLSSSNIFIEDSNVLVGHGTEKIHLGSFLQGIRKTPCILVFHEAQEFLKPRECDHGFTGGSENSKKNLTGYFLSILSDRDKKFIPVIITSEPSLNKEEIDSIDQRGYSSKAELKLYSKISEAILGPHRFSHQFFSFHKPLDISQWEILSKRFLRPYIKSGKMDEPKDYNHIAQLARNFTPRKIEEIVSRVATGHSNGKFKLDDVITALEKEIIDREELIISEREELLKSIVGYLKLKNREIVGQINFREIALASNGLSDEQINTIFEKYLPVQLTQESILEAFSKARK